MKNISLAFGVCVFLMLIVSSCKKDTSTGTNPPNNAAPATWFAWNTYNFTSARVITSEDYNETKYNCDGGHQFLSIPNTKINSQQFTVGCASALINIPQYAMADLSNVRVSCNSYSLRYSGGCVIPVPTPMTTGYSDSITFGPLSTWTRYSGDTLLWSYTDAGNVPAIADILSGETVSTTGSYTLAAMGNVSGDSVIFSITGPLAQISHTLGSNAGSYTFTAAEMASLGTTKGSKSGLLQIAPYNFHLQTIDSLPCYFIKETCLSKYVILQ